MKKLIKGMVMAVVSVSVFAVYAWAIMNNWALGAALVLAFLFMRGAYDGGKFEWED